MDKAVWRRFQLRIELPAPAREQLTQFIASVGQRSGINFGYQPRTLADYLLGSNYAEVEEFCLGIIRRAVLDQQMEGAKHITKLKLEQWRERLKPSIIKETAVKKMAKTKGNS
nr:hypothetical protein [Cardiobacterium valvarum]